AFPVLFRDRLVLLGGGDRFGQRGGASAFRLAKRGGAELEAVLDRERAAWVDRSLDEVTAVAAKGELYLFGGNDVTDPGAPFASRRVWKTEGDRWVPSKELPVAVKASQGCTVPDGRIALVSTEQSCLYDPRGEKSERLPPVPEPY